MPIAIRAGAGSVLAALCTAASSLTAQTADSLQALNRVGQWEEVSARARDFLAADKPSAALSERCQVRAHRVYALRRLRRTDEMISEGRLFQVQCGSLPATHWAQLEVAAALADTMEIAVGKDGSASSRAAGSDRTGTSSPSKDDDWRTITPEAAELDPAVLEEHRALCERSSADACIVVRRGALVQEWYGPRYREPIRAMSSTKSVTGLLAGMLAADGKLAVTDPVARFIPEWGAGAAAGVTIQHLLSMTSGLPDPPPGAKEVGSVRDKEAHVFGLPLAAQPGTAWAYSNDGVFLLSPVLDRAAGEPIEEYALRRLFLPLGMKRTRMHVYPTGQAWTHADLETTPRDLARIGALMLQDGQWGGRQVVPADWVQQSVTPSQALNPRYGLLWWLDVPEGFAARGYLNTNVYVFPGADLVIVRMQSKPQPGAARYEPDAFSLFKRMVR